MVDHIQEDHLQIIIYRIHLRLTIMVGEDNGSSSSNIINNNEIGSNIINIHPNNRIRISHQVHHAVTTHTTCINRVILHSITWEEDGDMDEEMDLDEDEDLDRLNSRANNGEIHVGEVVGVEVAGK
jgi:hypothetical protein